MKTILLMFLLLSSVFAKDYSYLKELQLNPLTKAEQRVILHKGTERPFSGKYYKNKKTGVYTCKQCGAHLYESHDKFDSHCGWPSFDDEIKGAIKRVPDADGRRVEIVCARCNAHLGHVFVGEGMTAKNTRHCVNSISLNFEEEGIHKAKKADTMKKAYFAGGCFWGVEYYLEKIDGVKSVDSGYMGGHIKNPTYQEVSSHHSGHLEVVEVVYDSSKVSYETLAKRFFEIHDPTQKNGQGPDIGSQYLSAIFTSNENEKKIIYKLVGILEAKGLDIATKIYNKVPFYKAEAYHQDHYDRNGRKPYCHSYKKLF